MAGLTKDERTAKAAYLASSPAPVKDWKDLTDEEKAPWFDAEQPQAPKEEIPPRPPMTIEQGHKTPAVVEWERKYGKS